MHERNGKDSLNGQINVLVSFFLKEKENTLTLIHETEHQVENGYSILSSLSKYHTLKGIPGIISQRHLKGYKFSS